MQTAGASPLHIARVRDDLVLLDLGSGGYEMAVGAFAGAVGASEVRAVIEEVVGDRCVAALAPLDRDAVGVERPRLRALAIGAPGVSWRDRYDFAHAWSAVALTYPGRSLRALLARRARATAPGDAAEVERRAAVFAHLLPWTPFPGACLHRAYFLRLFLRRAGCDADWVFGVRTWPFRAHCWLEARGVVLNDDPEAVRAYTPILRG